MKGRLAPWLAGASLALGHIALSTCNLPREGRCNTCGSCLLLVGTLAGWALWQRREGRPHP